MFSVSISVNPFELNCVVYCRWTFLRQRRHTARARSAGNTPCIRLHSTRRARIVLLFRESAAMTASNLVMEDRPNLSSTKRSKYNVHLCESMLRTKVMEKSEISLIPWGDELIIVLVMLRSNHCKVWLYFSLLLTGKDYEEDCAKVAVPELQAHVATSN